MRMRTRLRMAGCEKGATLVLVAAVLIGLLAAAGLAIDLGLMYVARSEAQRAADAAALAGAYTFMSSGCATTGDCTAGGSQEQPAAQQAVAVGGSNTVVGNAANINCPAATSATWSAGNCPGITFSYPTDTEPQISVTVNATVPTIFARVLGANSVNVSASATAEAFNPPNQTNGCVTPFLAANCDTYANDSLTATLGNNPACPAPAGYFIDPNDDTKVDTNVLGQQIQLHYPSGPGETATPSQWYLIAFAGSQSGSFLRSNISSCAPVDIGCGTKLQTYNGDSVGPVDQGVNTLINASKDGLDNGQDSIDIVSTSPLNYQILGGSSNPNQALRGVYYSGPSSSIVTVPVYDGHQLQPGSNGSTTNLDNVTVIGWLQMFITQAEKPGTNGSAVDAYVLNVIPCGSSSATSTNTSWSPIPIRLIHQ